MSTARSPASSTITPQNIDEFANVLRVKNQSSNNLQFLFRSNGSDNFPGRTSQNGFRADQWSVPDGSQQEVNIESDKFMLFVGIFLLLNVLSSITNWHH